MYLLKNILFHNTSQTKVILRSFLPVASTFFATEQRATEAALHRLNCYKIHENQQCYSAGNYMQESPQANVPPLHYNSISM